MLGPDAEARFRKFASTDDGKESVMVNLNKYRLKPKCPEGREVNMSPREVEELYISHALPRLIARACHLLIVLEIYWTG